MAVSKPRDYRPKMPRPETIVAEDVAYTYDRASDIFAAHLRGLGYPAVSVAISDFVSLRVDPVTEEVVGLEIEDYLGHAVFAVPAYLDVAGVAGISPEEIAGIRAEIERRRAHNPQEGKEAALGALLAILAPPKVA